MMTYNYSIPGTRNTCPSQPSLQCDDFDERYEDFKTLIQELASSNIL